VKLTANDVAEIMRLVDESGFDEINLEIEGVKLSLRRGGAGKISEIPSIPAQMTPDPSSPAKIENERKANTVMVVPEGAEVVRAPLLGTFYRAPKPGAEPYIDVGANVEPDTIIGIIEVMKLMNPVRAGVYGTVLAIVAKDNHLVEFDEPLMFVKKAS